jgi:hypothetical protein
LASFSFLFGIHRRFCICSLSHTHYFHLLSYLTPFIMITLTNMVFSSKSTLLLLLLSITSLCAALPPFHASSSSTRLSRSGPPPDHDHGDSDHGHGHGGYDGNNTGDVDLSVHPWIPAREVAGSSRSPCPLLNTLANHGFLYVMWSA